MRLRTFFETQRSTGTSTYDGLALAISIAEDLLDRIGAFTLFATHYFELTELGDRPNAAVNVHMEAIQHEGEVAFLHTVKDGATSRSYGIEVAKLAGVLPQVIRKARKRMEELELRAIRPADDSLGLYAAKADSQSDGAALVTMLNEVEVDGMSPREALAFLYHLVAEASNKNEDNEGSP